MAPTGIDSREAWLVTFAALTIAAVALGAPFIVAVALQPIAADFGGYRAAPSAAASLAMLGTGVGGLLMGWLAEHIGIRKTVMLGAAMVAAGLVVSAGGSPWHLWLGHGLLIGLLGNGAINAPLYVYVTRWFERRRGTGLALIASGQYMAGAIWPPLFERAIAAYGWQRTMIGFAVIVAGLAIPLAALFLRAPPPHPDQPAQVAGKPAGPPRVLGLPPNLTFALLAIASFLCCVPMAMPQQHIIAFCGDLGLPSARGAQMLSLLLITAFLSRQFWGWMSDRVGGLATLVACSLAQAAAMTGFLFTQDEASLLAVTTAFGLGFSGLIPAYVLVTRQHFPASETSWRVPALLLTGMAGMAAGSFVAGWLYDLYGAYLPAFATGLAFNIANFLLIMFLVATWHHARVARPEPS